MSAALALIAGPVDTTGIVDKLILRVEDKTDKKTNKPVDFIKKHPILFNLFLIVLVGCGIIWLTLVALDVWTGHGEYRVVPDMKGLSYEQAVKALDEAGLRAELSDSIYDSSTCPGTVLEQSPKVNAKVKPNRTVYLTINAFSPRMISVPSLTDMSLRQARSTLEGLGFEKIRELYVPSEYKDLVLGVRFNGIELDPGARVPASASLTIVVGQGITEESSDTIVDMAVADDAEAEVLDLD